MAPFSIDLQVREQETESLPPGESPDEEALRGGLAAALQRLADAGQAGKAGRFADRAGALGDAMAILDQIVSDAPLAGLDERGRALPRALLRVMHLLLHANLSGGPVPLRMAAEALKSVRDSWSLDHAAVEAD